jgi:hypothetical protein
MASLTYTRSKVKQKIQLSLGAQRTHYKISFKLMEINENYAYDLCRNKND